MDVLNRGVEELPEDDAEEGFGAQQLPCRSSILLKGRALGVAELGLFDAKKRDGDHAGGDAGKHEADVVEGER